MEQALDHSSAALNHDRGLHTGWVGRVKALIEVDIGLFEEARGSAEMGLEHARAHSNEIFTLVNLGVLGRLELVRGDLKAAGRCLHDLPARLLAGGVNDPTLTVWADSIETLIALGELEQARSYLEHYEANAQRLGSPLALAGAARCRGLLAGAEGDAHAAYASFERALAELDEHRTRSSAPARCSAWAWRAGRRSRSEPPGKRWRQALAIFEELGARLWAEKARAELSGSAGGARRPRSSPKPSIGSPSSQREATPTRRSPPSSSWG